MKDFGRMILEYSGFPESSASGAGGNSGRQASPNLDWNQRKSGRPVHEITLPPPVKRGRPSTSVKESGNTMEAVPRTILPRLPKIVGEQVTEYPAKVLVPMDRRKKVMLMVAGVNLEPSLFSNFSRTNYGQQGWVLTPPRVINVKPVSYTHLTLPTKRIV